MGFQLLLLVLPPLPACWTWVQGSGWGRPAPAQLPRPSSSYQRLSAAYSPITTESQRERQKGLSRQVFEQDICGDEKGGPEDAVSEPLARGLGASQGVSRLCVCVEGSNPGFHSPVMEN